MPIDFKKLIKDKKVLAVAGVGGALGIGVAVARRKGAGVANPADLPVSSVTAPYVPLTPATYDSSLSDIYEGFNQTALDLQNQINAIGDQLDQTTPPTSTTPPPTTNLPGHLVTEKIASALSKYLGISYHTPGLTTYKSGGSTVRDPVTGKLYVAGAGKVLSEAQAASLSKTYGIKYHTPGLTILKSHGFVVRDPSTGKLYQY